MGWLTTASWRRISRPLQITDEDDAVLGTVRGKLGGLNERELEGGAEMADATAVFRSTDLARAGIQLRRMHRVADPDPDSTALYSVESVRQDHGPGGKSITTANLTGLR